MTDDAIRAALDAAAKRLCMCDGECFETRHGMMNGPCEMRRSDAAAAIVRFLRSRAEDYADTGPNRHPVMVAIAAWLVETAAAVERAVQEDRT